MKGITTLLFDIDGTLLDTTEFIMQAFEHTLKSHDHKVHDRSLIDKHMGKTLAEIYIILTNSQKDIDKRKETHIDFQCSNFGLVKPFLNTLKTLEALKQKGYKLG